MYRKSVLKNGVRILSEKLDYFRSVSLGIWVNVGSREEEARENGISHFIEHMLFKGTPRRDSLEIAKELDAIGGYSNAFTGKEYTCFHSKVLDNHLSPLSDILSDIFLNSLFDPHEVDRERHVILQEISQAEDTPDEHIHVLFSELFWPNHPIGKPVLGTQATVSTIQKEAMLQYLKRFYAPERILIAAAGHIDHDELVGYFQALFADLEPRYENSPGPSPQIHSGISCESKDLEQVHMCLGGKGPLLSGDLRFAGTVLNTILGGNMSSRLFQEIREKRGLAYSVYSFISAYMDTGLLGVYVGTDPSEANPVLEITNREIRKIQRGEISREDLEATREHLTGSILLGAESTDSRMMRLAKNEYVFGRYIGYEELLSNLQKVTVDEVVTVAREAFRRGQVSLAALGPLDESELDLGCLRFE
jgi:predicted Zn-dependent peptidase